MTPRMRGLLIALVHVLLVAGVAGVLLYERQTLPRAWVLTTGYDPMLPIRGRYVALRLVLDAPLPEAAAQQGDDNRDATARLQVVDGRLCAAEIQSIWSPADPSSHMLWLGEAGGRPVWTLREPVLFFLSEHAPDPTRLEPGQELWVEVTLPASGPPRPIRLEIR